MNGVLAQLVNTPEVEGIDYVDCTIIKIDTELNLSYNMDYQVLSDSDKKTVDDFIALVIRLAPNTNQ
jgi:hypothetical protein